MFTITLNSVHVPLESTFTLTSCRGVINFALLHATGGIAEGLQDVFALQVRIVSQQLVDAAAVS